MYCPGKGAFYDRTHAKGKKRVVDKACIAVRIRTYCVSCMRTMKQFFTTSSGCSATAAEVKTRLSKRGTVLKRLMHGFDLPI